MANKFLEKLKKENERLKKDAEARGSGGFEKIDWYKPEMGDNMIRILHNEKDEFPYIEAHVHYIPVEKKTGGTVNIPIRCRQDIGEDCPLCDAYEKMVKKDKDKARDLLRRKTFLFNVINYKERKVQPWAAGVTIATDIMGYAADIADEDINVFSEDSGRDWKLNKFKDPRKTGNFAIGYKIRPSSKDSPIPEKVAHLVEGAVDLTTLYPASDDDKKKMLNFLGSPEEEVDMAEFEEEEEELPKVKAPPAAVAKAKAAAAAAKTKTAAKPAAKPAAKAKPPVEEEDDTSFEEDEDLGVDTDEDEDLEAELRELGV